MDEKPLGCVPINEYYAIQHKAVAFLLLLLLLLVR
jgi:hypothetical protein